MNNLQLNIAFIKIEFLIRQTLSYGQTIENNFEPVMTQQIVGTLVKDSCEVILATMERNSVKFPVDQELLNNFHNAFCNELNGMFHALQLLQGLPIPLLGAKYELRVRQAATTITNALHQLLTTVKSF